MWNGQVVNLVCVKLASEAVVGAGIVQLLKVSRMLLQCSSIVQDKLYDSYKMTQAGLTSSQHC